MGSLGDLDAAVLVTEASSEAAVLDRLVDVGRELFGASFAAALLVGPDGEPTALAHLGMSTAEVAALPHLPRPVGLLGVVLGGVTLRLDDLSTHPGAIGLPPGHVEMVALLGVPITAEGRVVGGIWLTRRRDEGTFDAQDESRLDALVTLAGATVLTLQRRTAASAVVGGLSLGSGDDLSEGDLIQRLLSEASELLGTDVTFVSKLENGRQTFTDVHQGTGGLVVPRGLVIDADQGLCQLQLDGAIPTVVADVSSHPATASLPVTEQLGIGSYAGVPVHLPGGALYGTLCGLDRRRGVRPTATQMATLEIVASLVGALVSRRDDEAERRSAAAREFEAWFTDDRATIHLQPIVDLGTRRVRGYEALSRFTDTYGASRRPDLMFAEAAGLGVGIRLEQSAVRRALQHLDDLPSHTYLSVNLSPQALLAPSTFDLLTGAVSESPGRVVVELTEHDRVPDYPALLNVLAGLRERGLRLAIDDLGAGFSSLQHVITMRPDVIKLDQAFVRDVDRDPGNRAVARAMTAFATDIGASMVAEGIETRAELEQLLELGTPLGQGYLLGRPAPVAATLGMGLAPT